MPRLPRLHAPGAIYHVTMRGNHRNDIFFRRADRRVFDDIMAEALDRTGARVHAYCWMTNHFHLLAQVGLLPLGRLMQRVGTRFARFIQKQIPTTGHLFENRYHALLVDVDQYFLQLVRYIHLNPVRAGIVNSPEQYLWSSHRTYLGKVEQGWVDTSFALSLFSDDVATARIRYCAFVDERIGQDSRLVVQGHAKEPRVMGSDRFLDTLAIPVLRRHPKTTLEALTDQVCTEFNLSLDQLRAPGKRPLVAKARATIARRAIQEQVASASDVARFLGRSLSALTRAMDRYQR